jgi:hemoglobin-like flavoprotein
MSSEQILLVQASFAAFLRNKERVLSAFHDRLIELDPNLRPLFKGDLARQRSRLALAISTIVHGLKNPTTIEPVLHELGRRHASFCVRPEHYATMGEALLWALEEALGDEFTAATREAWANAYRLVASAMLEGAGHGIVGRAA